MEWLLRLYPLLDDNGADDGAGGGAGGGDGGGDDAAVQAALTRFLNKNGFGKLTGNADIMAPLQLIYRDNYQARAQKRALEQKIDALQKAQVPDGGVALDKDQAALWQTLQDKQITDQAKLTAVLERAEKLPKLERQQLLGKAARAAGYKDHVLDTVLGDLPVQLKDPKADPSKPDSYVVVHQVDGKDTQTAVTDWVKQNRADYLPSLIATGGTLPNLPPGAAASAAGDDGKAFVKQWAAQRRGKADDKAGQTAS